MWGGGGTLEYTSDIFYGAGFRLVGLINFIHIHIAKLKSAYAPFACCYFQNVLNWNKVDKLTFFFNDSVITF